MRDFLVGDESMDVDPNYDPSDFLGGLKRNESAPVEEDLAVSESDDEMQVDMKQEFHDLNKTDSLQPQTEPDPDDDGALWF